MVASGGAQVDAAADEHAAAPAIPPAVAPAPDDFAAFFVREHPRVLTHALWLVRDLSAAEDLTQDAFLAAHRRWDHVAALDWPVGWVQRVVSNRAVSRYRRTVRDGRLVTTLTRNRPVPVAVDEDRTDLWDAVSRLPARQAQAIALVYGAGYSVAEAAAVLGCGAETVKTHLARGRRALAAALEHGREAAGDGGAR